jgi:hypothetical protein
MINGVHYIGEYKPVKVMRNNLMIAGYSPSEKTGESLEWTDTYNDAIFSATVQGKSVQDGTPSHSAPVPIISAGGNLISRNADGSLSSTVTMPALRSLPNGVKDTLEYLGSGSWRHTQNIGRKVFDGTEGIGIPSTQEDLDSQNYTRFRLDIGTVYNSAMLCTHAPNAVSGVPRIGAIYQTMVYVYLLNTTISGVLGDTIAVRTQRVKDWLAAQYTAGTPLIVDYQLATPVVTDLQLGDLKTYPHYTKLEQDGAVKATITASVLVSI